MAKNIAEFMTKYSGQYISKIGLKGNYGEFTSVAGISPLFGGILSDWIIETWEKNGRQNPVQLVELGPGTGAMMKYILANIAKKSPQMYGAIRVVFLEHSKILEDIQKKTLSESAKFSEIKWISDIRELPSLPFIMVANEFFSCLPIHQVVSTENGLKERMIEDDKFVLGDEEPTYLIPYMAREHLNSPPDSIIEVGPYAVAIINFIAERMAIHKSTALILDYGYEIPQVKDTLQAVKDDKYCSLLEADGEVEITAQVDFSALRTSALQAKAKVYGPLKQGLWFKRMRLEEKASLLIEKAEGNEKQVIEDSLNRLLSHKKSGAETKAMFFSSKF